MLGIGENLKSKMRHKNRVNEVVGWGICPPTVHPIFPLTQVIVLPLNAKYKIKKKKHFDKDLKKEKINKAHAFIYSTF